MSEMPSITVEKHVDGTRYRLEFNADGTVSCFIDGGGYIREFTDVVEAAITEGDSV